MEREQIASIVFEDQQASIFRRGVYLIYGAMTYTAMVSRPVPENELLYGHTTDFFSAATFYFACKSPITPERMLSGEIAALMAFSFCSSVELAQKFGLVAGTYDPKDFVAYGLGAGISYGLGKATNFAFKNREQKLLEQETQIEPDSPQPIS